MSENGAIISCKGVWKIFGPKPDKVFQTYGDNPTSEELASGGYIAGVRDANLDITTGEIIVIMGLSGSGKSTLVRCLCRLVEITTGEVLVEGNDIGKLSESELIKLRRSKMGMVFQSFGLLPNRTVLENVEFPLEMRGQKIHDRRERAMQVINLVSLTGREDYYPRELSGGQQQRVGIARSLAIEPDIWFLDEPFSALDPLIRNEMQTEFLRLQEMLGKTIVFITHDFDEALRLADRIAIMKDGIIVQCDTPDKIVMNPATEYVAKFTNSIEKSRVVHTATFMNRPIDDLLKPGNAVEGRKTLHEIAHQLLEDPRDYIQVIDDAGNMIGMIDRMEVLNFVLDN